MIPLGATHKLKKEHEDGPFRKYVKVVGDTYYSTYGGDELWFLDEGIADFIDYYDKIEDITCTKTTLSGSWKVARNLDEMDAAGAWPAESRIDAIGQNGNDGEHYKSTSQHDVGTHYRGLDKPVFTQAMADAGEKVKVGMLFKTATGRYTALLVSDDQVVFEHESLGFAVEYHEFIHPIDTRTPKQKAIDDAVAAISGLLPSCATMAGCKIQKDTVAVLVPALYDLWNK